MSSEIQGKNQDHGNRLKGWLGKMKQGLGKGIDGKDVIPETIERAHLEASEESINTGHDLIGYMNSQLTESTIINNSEARVSGHILEFDDKDILLSLGLPDHNFYIMYGSRAENKDKELDPKKYIDMVVEDIERMLAQDSLTNKSYELVSLQETIRSILKDQHGFVVGAKLEERVAELERIATDQLSKLINPMQTDSIDADGVTVPRLIDHEIFRVFDIECYK